MPPIRILVVDDSALHRKMLCAALSDDATIEIAGVAADGRIAVSKIQQLHPDLITLDIVNVRSVAFATPFAAARN